MSNDLKFEMKLKQIDDAVKRLEYYKYKGWTVMVESVEAQIAKLRKQLNEIGG